MGGWVFSFPVRTPRHFSSQVPPGILGITLPGFGMVPVKVGTVQIYRVPRPGFYGRPGNLPLKKTASPPISQAKKSSCSHFFKLKKKVLAPIVET